MVIETTCMKTSQKVLENNFEKQQEIVEKPLLHFENLHAALLDPHAEHQQLENHHRHKIDKAQLQAKTGEILCIHRKLPRAPVCRPSQLGCNFCP